jgi:hypothetical protein
MAEAQHAAMGTRTRSPRALPALEYPNVKDQTLLKCLTLTT